jgi:hypothetical protein
LIHKNILYVYNIFIKCVPGSDLGNGGQNIQGPALRYSQGSK